VLQWVKKPQLRRVVFAALKPPLRRRNGREKERALLEKERVSRGIFFAVLAAALYAVSTPCSKLLLRQLAPTMMAAFLYLGAGLGMLLLGMLRRALGHPSQERKLSREDLPYTLGMILLDIAAPIFLMLGLAATAAANVSLLNNFEIVATSIIALCIFKETISKRLWLAIVLVTAASMLLSFEDTGSLSFSGGSLFVLLACVCWGFENNCTRKLSAKDPLEIVAVKGICSGTGSLIIALCAGQRIPRAGGAAAALLLGFVAYGLSIYFYIRAQRVLGAAKTSTYYAVSPFIGAGLSLLIFRQIPGPLFLTALAVMAAGTYFASVEKPAQAG
jgi:drug/metabolite transporter (DMT)-like permease